MPKLTVQNAEIKTATVEVRTLTLSGKQVTLSVFKQIEQADLINSAGDVLGEAWGRVNYHPDKCADLRNHVHVVWQCGLELRRAAVVQPAFGPFGTDEIDQFLTAASLDHLQGGREIFNELPTERRFTGAERIGGDFELYGLTVRTEAADAANAARRTLQELANSDTDAGRERGTRWDGSEGSSRYDSALRNHDRTMKTLMQVAADYRSPLAELHVNAQQQIALEIERRRKVRAAWADLQELPQLFIAV